jgi:hypothetical protein
MADTNDNAMLIRRWRRKRLLKNILAELQPYGVESAYAHTHFVQGEEKRPKNITIYVLFASNDDKTLANRADNVMDTKFRRKKISIIDIKTLQTPIWDFVSKDLTRIQ